MRAPLVAHCHSTRRGGARCAMVRASNAGGHGCGPPPTVDTDLLLDLAATIAGAIAGTITGSIAGLHCPSSLCAGTRSHAFSHRLVWADVRCAMCDVRCAIGWCRPPLRRGRPRRSTSGIHSTRSSERGTAAVGWAGRAAPATRDGVARRGGGRGLRRRGWWSRRRRQGNKLTSR